MVPYAIEPDLARAAPTTSSKRLNVVAGCAVITIGDLPISMIGARSLRVS